MEYVNDRGSYADLPIDQIAQTFRQEYRFGQSEPELPRESFEDDVDRETAG